MTDLQHTQRHPWLAKVFGYALLGFVRLLTGAQARWYGSPPKARSSASTLPTTRATPTW